LRVFGNLRKLAFIRGAGSQDRKFAVIGELLASAKPKKARYIVKTVLGELRVGVAEGIIRDAITEAFLLRKGMDKEEKRKLRELVDYAWNITSDYREIARIAKTKGADGLRMVRLRLGKPIQVMLGLSTKSIDEVIGKFGKVAAEWKYNGIRIIIEKSGSRIWLFTRRLEDITEQFPDIVELAEKRLQAEECIVEGETYGIDIETGVFWHFQTLSQRIHRKYDVNHMVKQIPVQVNLFDIVYLNGETLLNKRFWERRRILEKIVRVAHGRIQLSRQIITDDPEELERFYHEALTAKQEGLMLKVLDAPTGLGDMLEQCIRSNL